MSLSITPILLLQIIVAIIIPTFSATAAADHYAGLGIVGIPANAGTVATMP